MGAVVGFVLAVLASSGGFGVPEGGAGAITAALLRRVEEAGGALRCGARVSQIVVRGGRAVAVRTDAGEEIEATRAVVADVAAPALYLRLLHEAVVPPRVARAMRRFVHGFGTFKMDFALDAPVPWTHPDAARAAVVHAGDSLDDLARFTGEVRAGKLPEHPYLVIGQQSLADPTRAPAGRHTLWLYSRVPSRLEGGWEAARERFADRIEARIEGLAPGFRKHILKRAIWSPGDLEALDENLVGGDLERRLGGDPAPALLPAGVPLVPLPDAHRGALPGLVLHPPRSRGPRGVRRQRGGGGAAGRRLIRQRGVEPHFLVVHRASRRICPSAPPTQ